MSAFPDTPTKLLTRIAAEASGEADESAWTEFFALYEPAMHRFVSRRGFDDATADDIVQDVLRKLVGILRRGSYDRARGPFRAYLATLLRNETIATLRRASARGAGRHVPLDGIEVTDERDPAAALEIAWRAECHAAIVRHVLNGTALARSSAAIYEEIERTGDSCPEVARRRGISAASVRQIKSRVDRMVAAFEKRYLAC